MVQLGGGAHMSLTYGRMFFFIRRRRPLPPRWEPLLRRPRRRPLPPRWEPLLRRPRQWLPFFLVGAGDRAFSSGGWKRQKRREMFGQHVRVDFVPVFVDISDLFADISTDRLFSLLISDFADINADRWFTW